MVEPGCIGIVCPVGDVEALARLMPGAAGLPREAPGPLAAGALEDIRSRDWGRYAAALAQAVVDQPRDARRRDGRARRSRTNPTATVPAYAVMRAGSKLA